MFKIFAYRVRLPDGLEPEQAFRVGLRGEAIFGRLLRPLRDDEKITPEVFAPNGAFVEFMHQVIAHRGPGHAGLTEEARRQKDGYVQIVDTRTREPQGDVPARDIIGRFAVRDGEIIPDSYQACTAHQLLSEDGFVQPGPELEAWLVEALLSLGPPSAE